MILRNLIVVLMMLVPTISLAQRPDDSRERDEEDRPRRPYARSERENEAAMAFMRENAPNRWHAVQMLSEDGPMRRNVLGFVLARYRMLQGIKEEDPKLYELKLQQLRVEDEVYGILSDINSREGRETLRRPLEEAARKLTELTLAEREQRIARLKEIAEREQQALEKDRQQLDTLVANRTQVLIDEGRAALRHEPRGARRERNDRPTTQPVR